MKQVGRKIAYDIATGNVLVNSGEMQGDVKDVTVEEIINSYTVLSERNRNTFEVLELPFGAYAQDFAENNGYRVNVETKELKFSYPDRNVPLETPVFQKALSEEVSELRELQKTSNQKFAELDKVTTSLSDFKKSKMAQLDELCNLAIVNGFKHTVRGTEYLFSCSLSAQANFTGTDLLFKDGFITDAQWSAINISTEKVERVTLSKAEFNTTKLKVFQHINANISKFRNTLQAQVESATTNTEVDLVEW